jgi:uncharacterized membrane protein
MMTRKLAWGLMALLSLLTVLVVSRYLTLDPEVFFPEQRAVYLAHQTALLLHVVGGMVALTLGSFLLVNGWRSRWPTVHRWLGRVYLLGILLGGATGLYMATFAYGGAISQSGFAMIGLLWLTTGLMAFVRIRQGNVAEHRRWMIRNFAITLAAVMLRVHSPLLMVLGVDFEMAYRIVAWSSWVPNLLVAEWIVRTRQPAVGRVALKARVA